MEAAVAAGAAWAKSAASLSTSSALSPDVASPRVCSSVFSSATCTHGRFGSGSGYPPSSSRPRGAQGGVASVPGFGIRVWSPSGRMLHGVTLSLLSAVKVIAASRPACRKDLLAAATTSGEARERRSPPPRPNADEQRGAAEDARRGSEVRTARIVTHDVSIEKANKCGGDTHVCTTLSRHCTRRTPTRVQRVLVQPARQKAPRARHP